jgi:hypothetical protein
MPELKDYSGPFNPKLTFADFSKEFLLKLIPIWQYAWLHMTEAWYDAVKKRFGDDAANHCEQEAWIRIAERVNPRYAKIANIPLKTVIDSMKVLQLPLDNTMGGLFPVEYDIKSPNHVILTIRQCRSLQFFEAKQPERINWVCHVHEPIEMAKYAVNPNIKVTPLKLPPRKSPEEIACQWEFKLEA